MHCGALSTVWGKWEDFYEANVKGTKNVIEACLDNRVKRLVHISSPSIYTEAKNKFLISEEGVVENNQLNYYIKSKILAERLVNNVDNEKLETVILRPRGLFGVGDTSIIPRIINANKKIGVPVFNEGQNVVDVTYVGNVSKAVELAIVSEKAIGKAYNITNGEPMAFKAIIEILFKELGYQPNYRNMNLKFIFSVASVIERVFKLLRITKEPILTKYTVITLGYSQTLDISRAKEDLGYEPIYSIQEGAKIYGESLSK